MPIDSNESTNLKKIKHPAGLLEFIEWFALPDTLKTPKTQKDFAKKIGVGEDTLSAWKQRKGFYVLVTKKRKRWSRNKTSNVLAAFYNKIVKEPVAADVRLWFELCEDWNPRDIKETLDERQPIPILDFSIGGKHTEYLANWARNNGYIKADGTDESDEDENI